MLGNAMRKYVMAEKRNGRSKQVQNVYKHRIKKYAIQALKDLALLAEKLPEDQQAAIFTGENMTGLFRALFKFPPAASHEEFVHPDETTLERIDRLLPLCWEIINLLNDSNFASRIAFGQWDVMRHEGGLLASLKAVYYRSLNQIPHKKKEVS